MIKNISLVVTCLIDGGSSYLNNSISFSDSRLVNKLHNIISDVKDAININAVIMCRHTWESLERPLNNVINIVITNVASTKYYFDQYDNVVFLNTIVGALSYCNSKFFIENIFVIGEANTINMFLNTRMFYKMIDKIYLSIPFYDRKIYNADQFIDIRRIFSKFKLIKDSKYKNESYNKLFASYLCIPR